MSASKTLFCFCIAFIAGIALQSLLNIPQSFLWGLLIAGAGCIAVSFFNKKWLVVIGFCILFLVLGILRLQVSEFTIIHDKVSLFNDRPEKIMLAGTIIDDPDVRETSQKLKVMIDHADSIVLVTTARYPEYHYLDAITVTGKLKTPMETAATPKAGESPRANLADGGPRPEQSGREEFSYKNYLLKDGIYSVMDFPVVALISTNHEHNPLTFLYEKLLQFKRTLRQSIHLNFAPPHSAIIEGIILGGTTSMSRETKAKFSATGLTHLTAISGSNVVILSAVLMAFLLFLGFWRHQAFYISVTFIWLYIIIAGFPASGIRAAIMATVFLLAQKLGRQNTSSRVIILAATLMLLQNPTLLLYDVGFQLSFLASMGIIHLKPLVDSLFYKVKHKKIRSLLDIVSITLAAQVFILPVIAYYFKSISLVAPVTNLLIIPIINWVMIFGFLAAFLGAFSNVLGFVFSIPAYALMLYFMKVIDIFGQPWAVKTIQNFPLFWIVIYYGLLAALIWWLDKKVRPTFLEY